METTPQRETKTLTTPGGKELVLKTYVTAREKRQLRLVFTSTTEKDDKTSITEDEVLRAIVVSFDGSHENVSERLLELPNAEMEFAVKECLDVVTPPAPKTEDPK